MDAWLKEKYMEAADAKDFEDSVVGMVGTIVNDNNRTFAELLGVQLECRRSEA